MTRGRGESCKDATQFWPSLESQFSSLEFSTVILNLFLLEIDTSIHVAALTASKIDQDVDMTKNDSITRGLMQ